MIYVFDASFIGALIIPDENNMPVRKLYDRIENEDERQAPHLLWYEMTNLFMNLLRRKRYNENEVLSFYPLLEEFRLVVDSETGIEYSKRLLRLCSNYNLSSYDAAYLELAERKRAVLCTLDERLRSAAKKHGVAVLKQGKA